MRTNKRVTKRIIIGSISIFSILSLSLGNSAFIHGTNPEQGFVPNINSELEKSGTHSIKDYSISRYSQIGNDVSYKIDYKEDGVWYWDQTKSDYVAKKWTKYANDSWYYGPQINLGQSGDDKYHSGSKSYAPKFTIQYTGSRPTHKVHHPEEWDYGYTFNSDWKHSGGGHYGWGDNPNTPYTDESLDDQYKAAWDEVVQDDWPNPNTAFKNGHSGWNMDGYYKPSTNQSYDFYWSSYNSKMSSFPKLKKNWTYTKKDEGDWNHSTYNHWNWSGSDYWKNPHRASTGQGNKSVYVDWTIQTNGVQLNGGRKDISTKDVVTQTASSVASKQSKPSYSATDSQKHSSNAPYTVSVPEPKDSDWFGVSGSEFISIGNLPIGNEYVFNADLKYTDKYGSERTFDSYEDTFSTSKSNDTFLNIWSNSDSENVINFGYELTDKNNVRLSDIRWKVTGDMGTKYSGTSKSNHFEQSFEVQPGEKATFEAEYDYSLMNDRNGNPVIQTSAPKSKQGATGQFYNDKVKDFEVWVDNIQDESFVFNYYLETNNNFVDPTSRIEINIAGDNYEINDVNPGTTSYLIETPKSSKLDNINEELTANLITPVSEEEAKVNINNQTNLVKDYSIRIIDNEYINNTEAAVNYVIDDSKLTSNVTDVEYNLNGKWHHLDYKQTNNIQTLELLNLNPETVYNLQFKTTTDSGRDYYSNKFKFKTDRSPSAYVKPNNVTSGEHSASMSFEIDKLEYIDNKNFTWGIFEKTKRKEKLLYTRDDVLTSNGIKTIYADGLDANKEYEFVVNLEIEGETVVLSSNVSTKLEKTDTINNAYINDVSTKKGKYNISYVGTFTSLEYSLDGVNWIETKSYKLKDGNKIELSNVKLNDDKSISFRLNNQMRSQYSYYEGMDNNLKMPKRHINIDWYIFAICMMILFIAATATLTSLWAWMRHKDSKGKIEGNIWKKNK